MSSPAPEAPHGPPDGPPPWIDDTMQQRIGWRDGDVVVAVPPKSGTTWMMNIVHQLRTGGDPTFADIYTEVPWLEFVPGPEVDPDDVVTGIDHMPEHPRRVFKTHAAPPTLPFQAPGAAADVRYVVVARNPDEALASARPFLAAHSDAWFDLWQVPRGALVGSDFAEFFAGIGSHGFVPMVFGFLAGWWPLRHEANVMFVHFAELKRDPDSSIRAVADFLGFDVTDAQWPAILDHASFSWMKAHEDKFEMSRVASVPVLDSGAMIRKGQVGASAQDGITPEISQAIAEIGGAILPDPAALDWLYHGGHLPD